LQGFGHFDKIVTLHVQWTGKRRGLKAELQFDVEDFISTVYVMGQTEPVVSLSPSNLHVYTTLLAL